MIARIKNIFRLSLCVAVFLVSCSGTKVPVSAVPAGENILLADPTILYHKGKYYLYGTSVAPYNDGFIVYTSDDLTHWKGPAGATDGYALKKGDAYGTGKFWAPQVFQYRDKFYMAYAANEHLAIAVSDSPLGPFKQTAIQALTEDIKQIDPFVFIDDDGKKYLYYVVVADGGNRIYAAEMKDDLTGIKKETTVKCIEATDNWENIMKDDWSVTEGPTVIKRNKLYYLFYSANHFKYADYAVGYAVSTSPYGPWKKYSGNPVISKKQTGENGSGHGDLLKDEKGNLMYVLHTHQSADKVGPRKTGLIGLKVRYDKKNGEEIFSADTASFRHLLGN